MYEAEETKMSQDEELVDILLDFIIVAASLAKKINQAIRVKQIKEGGNENGQTQRIGHGHQGPAQCRNRY